MKANFHIVLLTLVCLFFTSCEKLIEFDLAESESAIVIEATITNNKIPFIVLISKTSSYFGTETDNAVSGAKVSVRTERGNPKYFEETEPGVYKLENTIAPLNQWYIVDVESEGITYSARSFLNEPIPIVDLSFSYFDGFGFFENGYKVNCFINDPAGISNYYRLKYYSNGNPIDDKGQISLYADRLFDGKTIGLGQHSIVFKDTDILTVELQSIDEAVYNYFLTLENISGNGIIQSASPSNPISNFSNGALGYFSAYSFVQKTVAVKDYIQK